MHRFILHNEEIVDSAVRDLSPGQVGLLNGWGVFSTLRVYDGVLFAWERHWLRMQTDAKRLRVAFPENADALQASLQRLIEANGDQNTVVRVCIVRNRGGLWQGPVPDREFDIIAYTRDLTKWGAQASLAWVPNARHAASQFAGAKYLSWSENLTLYEQAHERGFDDALLLNERGEVAECTSANIFIVNGSRIWTTPLSSGCLPGVTRALVLQELGLDIGEKTLLPADLETADEVFMTSSTRETLPVAAIEGLRIHTPGPVQGRVQKAYRGYVESYVGSRAIYNTQRV